MKKRFSNLSSLKSYIPKITRSIYNRRGFYENDIIKDWSYIVGNKWSELTSPEKLLFRRGTKQNGVLYISVYGSASLMIQHIQPEIIDRINTYMGYKAVSCLKIIQGGLKPIDIKKDNKPIKNTELEELKNWDDNKLKEALQNLGQSIKNKG